MEIEEGALYGYEKRKYICVHNGLWEQYKLILPEHEDIIIEK
jgi:hypothetical protein